MSEVCSVCGTAADGETLHGGCIWCTEKRGYICRHCSALCGRRTRNMLPNGTRCLAAWKREPGEDRLLKRPFPASAELVAKERRKYEEMGTEVLLNRLREAAEWYDQTRDEDMYKPQLPTARARMTALQQIITERKEEK